MMSRRRPGSSDNEIKQHIEDWLKNIVDAGGDEKQFAEISNAYERSMLMLDPNYEQRKTIPC